MIHWWFKHKFLEVGDRFTVVSGVEREYICKEILVEEPQETSFGTYRPDMTIITESSQKIYFEFNYSNKKKIKDYLDMWLELKDIVVEVDIKQLILEENIPKFKALFYDGKCFNAKRNDTYYNTIGRYKEEKLMSTVDDELKGRIEKLDWFWDDLIRYKNNDVGINHIHNLIEAVSENSEDFKKIVLNVLKKQECTDVYNAYIGYKHCKINDFISGELRDRGLLESYKISSEDVIKWNKLYSKKLSLKYLHDSSMYYRGYDLLVDVIDDEFDDVKARLERIVRSLKDNARHDCAKNNRTLKGVIEYLDNKYKEYSSDYSIRFDSYHSNKTLINLNFCGNRRETLDIQDDIVYSSDYDFVRDFLEKRINRLITGVSCFKDHDTLINVLDGFKKKYNNMIVREDKIIKEKWIGRQVKTLNTDFSFNYNVGESISISMYINSRFNNTGEKNFYTCNDKLYQSEEQLYSLKDICSSAFVKLLNPNDLVNDAEKFIDEQINGLIRDEICGRKCIDCSEQLDITSGEVKFFIDKRFNLPKRCKSCRDKRKKENHK